MHPPIDRAKVVEAIKYLQDELERELEPAQRVPFCAECDVDAALARVCVRVGILLEAFAAALDADPELVRLHDEAIRTSCTDQPDPGPYDRLSGRDPPDSWLHAHDIPPRGARARPL